ncbi:hypothetical protein [Streptobacillus moniliformis]|uniref:hypothetical protein n=1 Tax=Streptobacillus moniliformis TaxID=34105 RepID=UPI0007E4A908|nr:hypothetical protein [Streptobacillus moniliformis]
MVKIAFYKDNYKWWSRLIKWFTKGKYSHCELYIDNCLIGISTEQKVRIQENTLNLKKWDVFELKGITEKDVMSFYEKTKGKKYDWKGILLTQVFNIRRHSKDKYTCSEWCAELIDNKLDILLPKNYYSFCPQELYEALKYKGLMV